MYGGSFAQVLFFILRLRAAPAAYSLAFIMGGKSAPSTSSRTIKHLLLSLEAYDLAVHKRYDILVLVASDGDYVPLVRKLNSIGIPVIVPQWPKN